MKKLAIVFTLSIILFFGTFSPTAMATVNQNANENSDRSSVFIPDRYIVVLEDGFSPQDVAQGHGLSPQLVYKKALNGFVATISSASLEKLKEDSRVKYVEQDQVVEITAQVFPTGMDRINLETNSIITVDGVDDGLSLAEIAVIDTGVDIEHPDLRVHPTLGIYCYDVIPGLIIDCNEGAVYADDDNGHGTHVAGIAAAKDNGIGVVGVAPGATIVPVKVLDANGGGSIATVIGGIDYVTLHVDSIDVANMSLRTPQVSQALNDAVAVSISAGIVYVIAAGNDVVDASTVSPASEESAITVSALADFDGIPGGLNDQTVTFYKDAEHTQILCTENTDDSFACFSNFGDVVDIIAPGVGILSTVPIGDPEDCFCDFDGLREASGTSMAAPHVAGAAALIRSQDFSMTPAEVESALLAMAIPKSSAEGYTIDSIDYHSPNLPPPDPSFDFEPFLMLGESLPPNPIPVADAGVDQIVNEQMTVYLDGSNSYDPEGEAITFTWVQTPEPTVLLHDSDTAFPSFTTPTVFAQTNLVFSLVVNDGLSNSLADDVIVTVANNVNELPTANAGIDQTVNDSDGDGVQVVTLDGSSSSDPNNDIQSWEWFEGGVLLIEGEIIGYSFSVGAHDVTLKVTDSNAETSTDLVQITVEELSTVVQITSPSYGESIEGKVTVSTYVENLLGTLNFLLIDTNNVEYDLGDADLSNQVSFHTKNYVAGNYYLTANVDDAEYDRIQVTIPSKGGGGSDKGGGGPDCNAKPNHPKC